MSTLTNFYRMCDLRKSRRRRSLGLDVTCKFNPSKLLLNYFPETCFTSVVLSVGVPYHVIGSL